jgi:NAD(P)-dependent dehydrogenase (short-subunit alcohol dehydrogenase family)
VFNFFSQVQRINPGGVRQPSALDDLWAAPLSISDRTALARNPHMTSFADRVVLITGAGSGIGRQMARTLAVQGARIAAVDRSADGLATLADELHKLGVPAVRFASAVADVTDWPGVQAATVELEGKLGPTDILVASAGVGHKTTAADYQAEVVAEVIRVNLIGVSNSVGAVLPGMRQRRRGHLVALSSMASYHGLPLMGAYCASKAGVNALCDALRVELRPFNVAVTVICPAWIRTPMTDNVRLPASVKKLDVEVAVARMVEAIRRRRPYLSFPAGAVWQMSLLRYLPQPLSDWLTGRLLRGYGDKL